MTFANSLSSEAVVETIEEMKGAVTKVVDTLTQEDFHGAFQKLLERYNKCIAAAESALLFPLTRIWLGILDKIIFL